MKITTVSHAPEFEDAESINFFSNKYFIDSTILYIKISHLKHEIEALGIRLDGLDGDDCAKVEYWTKRKKDEILEFYAYGGTVVIISDEKPVVYLRKNNYIDHLKIDFINIFTGNDFLEYNPFEGSNCVPMPVARKLSEICQIKFHATFIVHNADSKTLFSTIKTANDISFYLKKDKGLLIVLPHLVTKRFDQTWEESQATFLNCLLELIKTIKADVDSILNNSPKWLNEFEFSKEKVSLKELDELNTKQKALEAEINLRKELLTNYAFIKSILYTKGPELEIGIKRCLEHMKADFYFPAGSNTDLIIEDDQTHFAVEVKGSSGSASKQHVRQLEEWVNSAAVKHQKEDCKGILIINTFCDTPISKRIDVNFPPNVVEFSTLRNHCLITTITLLKIINDFDDGKIDKKEIFNLIRKTNGVLSYT